MAVGCITYLEIMHDNRSQGLQSVSIVNDTGESTTYSNLHSQMSVRRDDIVTFNFSPPHTGMSITGSHAATLVIIKPGINGAADQIDRALVTVHANVIQSVIKVTPVDCAVPRIGYVFVSEITSDANSDS